MSTPTSWREAYEAQKALGSRLEAELKRHLGRAPRGWYTETRLKEESSFQQKIETGNVPVFSELEDFVGALVVVPLPTDVPRALDYIGEFFTVEYRRPKSDFFADGLSSEFRFNDIRLYGKLVKDETMPPSPLQEVTFEIQVKTFFQHAWSSATHDLVYKHPHFSWSRNRIAAQVKAILEHAEMSLSAIDELESIETFKRDGEPENSLNEYLRVVEEHWSSDLLPENKKRMTETIATLCDALELLPADLDSMLKEGRDELDGHPDGWTPYQCIVDYTSRFKPVVLESALRTTRSHPKVIHVTDEVLIRLGLQISECPVARL